MLQRLHLAHSPQRRTFAMAVGSHTVRIWTLQPRLFHLGEDAVTHGYSLEMDTGHMGIVGLEFLDSFEEVAQSWLAWELKANNIKVILARQRRRAVRVECLLPARLITPRKQLQARVLNLSPYGALVQSQGRLLETSEKVAVCFGPIGHLNKLMLKGWVANVHVSGAPTYGVEFVELEGQELAELKRYLDFFREDAA